MINGNNGPEALTENTLGFPYQKSPALIVEILGPAGAGKTTLSRNLSQRNDKIQVGVPLQKLNYLPSYINTALVVMPALLPNYRNTRRFTWGEIRAMAYLRAWLQALERQTQINRPPITVLDHGPIYRLALLHEFGPEIIKGQKLSEWWSRMLNRWSATLDMIIWLDAPDVILLNRIYTRGRWHRIKGISEQEGCEFIARFRRAFEYTISMLDPDRGPKVLRLDTNQETMRQLEDLVLSALETEAAAVEYGKISTP